MGVCSNDPADTVPVVKEDADSTSEQPVPKPRSKTQASEHLPTAVEKEVDMNDRTMTPTSEPLSTAVEKEAPALDTSDTSMGSTILTSQSPPIPVVDTVSPDFASLAEPVPSSATSDGSSTSNATLDTSFPDALVSSPVPKPRSKRTPASDPLSSAVDTQGADESDQTMVGFTTPNSESPIPVIVAASPDTASFTEPVTAPSSAANGDSPTIDATPESDIPPHTDDCNITTGSPSPNAGESSPTNDISPPDVAVQVTELENTDNSNQSTGKKVAVDDSIEKVLPSSEQPLLSEPAQPHAPAQKQAKKPSRPPPPVQRPQGRMHLKEPEASGQAKSARPAQSAGKNSSPLPDVRKGNICRLSPRASPQASPHASPQTSPQLSPRTSPQPSPRASPRASPARAQAGGLEGGVHVLKYSDRSGSNSRG